MGEMGNETNIQWLIVLLKSVPKFTAIGCPLLKLLCKKCRPMHGFFETRRIFVRTLARKR